MDDEFSADTFAAFKAKQAATQREAAMTKAVADPETAAILAETRGLQQETVESSRNAAKMIKETAIVGEKTTAQLRDQGEQLRNIEVVAEEADKHAQDAYKQAKDLHKYKGLLPVSIRTSLREQRRRPRIQSWRRSTRSWISRQRNWRRRRARLKPVSVPYLLQGRVAWEPTGMTQLNGKSITTWTLSVLDWIN